MAPMDAASSQTFKGEDVAVVADRIRKTWGRTVESVVAVGLDLKDVRDSRDDEGHFKTWVKSEHFAFKTRTAQRLIAIAENPVLADATHVSFLPARWSTLYVLTGVPDEAVLKKLIDDGGRAGLHEGRSWRGPTEHRGGGHPDVGRRPH
jgi:hypothetical protein